jgi:ribonucleoside-diphosphate reductase alpha chain
MDDIIDLELEKIDKIIAKIEGDPESEELKLVERNLWTNIRKKSEEGRRTGIGITAEGDMLAGLWLRYGSDEANEFSENVHKTLAIEAYKASIPGKRKRPLLNL